MTKRLRAWAERNFLWLASILIALAFAGLDGRYLRSYMFDGWLGDVCAYTGNFLIDLSSEYLTYEFTRHQRDTTEGRARDRKRLISWILLIGALGLLYFALVFSYRQASLLRPGEPDWLRWSIASFAQVALMLIGVANALRDYPAPKAPKAQGNATKAIPEAMPEEAPEPQTVITEPFACEICGRSFAKQNSLNGHMKAHSNHREQVAEEVRV